MSKHKAVDALLVVSDLHCGSEVGLCPPGARINEQGNTVEHGANAHQAWLWACWQDMCDRATSKLKDRRWALLVNGDATEGIHHHSPEVIATRIKVHADMAIESLRPLAKAAARVYVTAGTECHTSDMERYVAHQLDAEGCQDKWHIDINGCLIDAAHHMGVTSRANLEASGLGIHMANARHNYQRVEHRVPKVFLRGHRHCGGVFNDGYGIFAVTGGWQYLTRHGHKVVTDSLPTPTALLFDWSSVAKGELPNVTQYRYPPPQPEIHRA